MRYRRLGSSNLKVSELCLGTMMFADQTDAKEAAAILAAASEQGVNFIDTADVYSKGACETMLGGLLAGQRNRWILASKVGNAMSDDPNHRGYGRVWMMRALEDSLRRLQTDHLDIWYLHRDWDDTHWEETLGTIADVIRSGKIRYWAISNMRGWRIAQLVALCARMSVPAPSLCQPYYNLLNRVPEVEILPACQAFGLGVVPYSPIARGVLSGKYQPGVKPNDESRAGRLDRRMMQTEWREESLAVAQRLAVHCTERSCTLVAFAVQWLLANRIVSSVIAGPRTLKQWNDYLPAIELSWTDRDEQLVDLLVPPGHPSTPGYSDPQYPFHGRQLKVRSADPN
jgi:aryl-alcohol dehydrogenase-like predicted oxidoreductase